MKVAVRFLIPGDMIDLEGDKFADPARSNIDLRFETCAVESVEKESVNNFVVYTDKINCAFPPDHEVEVVERFCNV